MNGENKRKHLEMLQGIINRMGSNSFLLKSWSVVLVSALFALAAKESNVRFVFLAYYPAIAFWILDGYFLWQEKLYRALYDKVRVKKEEEIDYSMSTKPIIMETKGWIESAVSKTPLIFHGAIIGTIVFVMILMWCIK